MGGNLRIVIAEQNSVYSEQIIRELKKASLARDIEVVHSAKALAAALQKKTDLLISSAFLPGLSGPDLLAIIRDKELDVPVIIFSDNDDIETAVACIKNGAADFISLSQLSRLTKAVTIAVEQAEAHVREKNMDKARRFAQLAYDRAAIGIFWLNPKGRFLLVNASAAEALGYSAAELYQMNISDVDATMTPAQWEKLVNELRATPSIAFESQHRHKQGRALPVEVTANHYTMDKLEYILLFSLDISRRKKAEQEYVRMEQQVQHVKKMEALGRMAGGVAHEFNNMLMVMQNSAEFIILDCQDQKAVLSYAEQIIRTSRRAAALTTQLLAFSRKQQFEQKVLDLNATLTDMIKWLRRLVKENVSVTADLHEDIGHIKIDPGELGQIIINLVMNASDAMPAGGDLIISTEQRTLDEKYCKKHLEARPGRYLVISMQDTGQGMDGETLSKIFEPFFTTKENGTGLGLSIVFGLVQQNGGHIECESGKGKGARFRVFLPYVEMPVSAAESLSGHQVLLRGTETILLVEDEPEVRAGNLRTLEKLGYKVLCAQNGLEALHLLDSTNEPVHLLMTDVIMPYMNGAELATKVQKKTPQMKVLYMSAYPKADLFKQHHVNVEKAFFIGKPFSIEEIAAKLREVLGKR